MPMWMSTYTQDSSSPIMEHLKFFHDHTMIIIISLSVMFFILMIYSVLNEQFNHFYLESQLMEFFWTFAPSMLLMFLAIPSLKMLYLIEEQMNPVITLKVTGYQWFWGYEYFNMSSSEKEKVFDSNIMSNNKTFKLLEVSNNVVLPYSVPVRFLITSKDVIHSWAIPSISIKMDAMPGRINQTTTTINRPGILVGQCSEICGSGHSFMPIYLEAITFKKFF